VRIVEHFLSIDIRQNVVRQFLSITYIENGGLNGSNMDNTKTAMGNGVVHQVNRRLAILYNAY